MMVYDQTLSNLRKIINIGMQKLYSSSAHAMHSCAIVKQASLCVPTRYQTIFSYYYVNNEMVAMMKNTLALFTRLTQSLYRQQ